MTTSFKKIQTVTVSLETHAGSLCDVYIRFRDADINVLASWGYEMGPEQAEAILYVDNVDMAVDVLKEAGKDPKLGYAVYAEGDDQVGVYAEPLLAISEAGINLHATDAFAVGGRFVTVFFCSDTDVDELCEILEIE